MKNRISVLIAIIIILALLGVVYFVISRGGLNKGVPVSTIFQSPSSIETPAVSQPNSEEGNVTSSKISLVVTSPKDGDSLNTTNVTVKGKTTPNADVFVNDQSGKADASGNFAIGIGLDEGENQIVVSANDSVGNATEQDLTVNVASF